MKRYGILFGLWLVMVLGMAATAQAVVYDQHYFNCKNCHKANLTFTEMGSNKINVCLQCHDELSGDTELASSPPPELDGKTASRRSIGDASNHFGRNDTNKQKETSHIWGVTNTLAAAGAQEPSRTTYAGFYSRYNTSVGKVTCSRCHNPHGDAEVDILDNATGLPTADLVNNVSGLPGPDGFPDGDGIPDDPAANRILMPRDGLNNNLPLTPEQVCRACHVPFDKNNGTLPEHDLDGLLTHPLLDDYATFQGNNADKYRTAAEIAAITTDSKVKLVSKVRNGTLGVGCTSCHGAHYVDSDSSTPDGPVTRSGLAYSDGHLLRSDGPERVAGTRDTDDGVDNILGTADDIPGTGQLRSNLCQSCHTYKMHGKGGNQQMTGCLDCHGGHSYNGGTPSAFVLRNQTVDAVPVRLNRAPNGTATVTFPQVLSTPTTRGVWSDGVKGTSNGYCEKCHGDVEDNDAANGVGKDTAQHLQSGWIYQCDYCHVHDEDTYSFAVSGSAATCGDCHGFPPYIHLAGNRTSGGTDGGYAYVSATHNYLQASGWKTENTTPHNTHAAGGTTQGAATDYMFATGTAACDPCHLDKAMAPTHNEATAPGSYRDMAWNSLATGNGVMTGGAAPNYNTSTWVCTNIYCHTNGGKRNASGTKVLTDFVRATTPSWANGDGTIVGKTTPTHQCNYCHGNSYTSMDTGQKNNSASHIKHVGPGTFTNNYTCNVCHQQTATSNTALATNARLVNNGGKHVNGSADVAFDTTYNLGSGLLTSTQQYSGGAFGTCTAVYCHSNGKGAYYPADWDLAATGACGTCHQYYSGTTPTGAGAALSAPHAKHLAITLPSAVTCVDCHGTNAAAGTHTGHVDGAFTIVANACNGCHGWEAGETVPAWGQPMDNNYCIGCHAGTVVGTVKTKVAPNKEAAKTRGHNRSTAAGVYPVSSNPPANKLCTDCHDTAITNHVDGTTGNATGLKSSAATCTTSCHGAGGSAARNGINSHVGKACVACHNVHGSDYVSNAFMIHGSMATQNAKDTSGVGEYGGNVTFSALSGADSYDEDDGTVGAAGEINADDLCATCHRDAAHGGTISHNNLDNTDSQAPGGHNIGDDCFDCHAPHTDTGNAFKAGAGNACDSCHGFPPNTGAHGDGTNKHARTAINLLTEDRSDCAYCHTGADLYTYDTGADQAAGGARGNHNKGDANQKNVLTASVGYNQTNFSCATACHLSSAADGAWGDANGLNCNACHYYEATVTGSANNIAAAPKDLKDSHNVHFAKSKQCAACHDVPASTTHISIPTGTDIQKIQNRAAALQNEADVKATTYGTGSDPDPGNPTCAGSGVGLGCHNTKTTPAWTTTGITCTNCHVVTGSATADPKTGLHNITAGGVQKHDSNLGINGCTECHNSTKPSTHADGVFNDDTAVRTDRFISRAGLVWTDSATPKLGTCFDNGTASLDSCHSDDGTWKRRWSTDANSTATATGSARCNVCHGQYYNLTGTGGIGWVEGTSHYKTFGGASSTRGETHNSLGGEINVCEDCHIYTTQPAYHRNSQVTMNDDIGNLNDTEVMVGTGVYCAECHGDGDPAVSGTFTLAISYFPLQKVAGANDPKAECNSCHGMGGGGRYWPVGPDTGGDARNNEGRHEIHMLRLAQSVYGFATVTDLLNDADTKNKQIELCSYCHTNPAHANHWSADGGLPAEVDAMYKLWLPKTVDSNATWTPSAGDGNCSNIDCHNGKATSSVANFTWYGTGTQNCLICHNDITSTTAGTTGATHQAHVGAGAAAFGKAMNCATCHGGSVTWAPYAVPTSNHINGNFTVGTTGGSSVPFTYGGAYTNAATRTVGNCGTNLCHNNGKDTATPAYTWQTAISGCAACHATSSALGSSHDPHMNAGFTSTFRATIIGCAECHDAVSATDMTGKTAHMDGVVNLVAGLTYTGTPNSLSVTVANTYGVCSASVCHENGQGADVNSPTWNRTASAADNCTICHNNGSGQAYPATGRHAKHILEPDYVTGCANCHTGATATTINTATHFNGTRNVAGSSSVSYAGTAAGTCTNTCHKVTEGRDWTSGVQPLICTDCHQSGTIASGKGALPVSGLHNMTATGVQKHDATLGSNGCQECHVTLPGTHLNGAFVADSGSNNDRFLTRTGMVWADGAANAGTCFDNGTSGLDYNAGAGCHRDNGVWKRQWSTNANVDILANPNPGQLVCDVCHGQYQTLHASSTGWREGSVHFNSGTGADENKGSSHNRLGGTANACADCHAYYAGNIGSHENGKVNFDGLAGAAGTFTLAELSSPTRLYCASCHDANNGEDPSATASHTFPKTTTGFTVEYIVGASYPEGGCTTCHGNAGAGSMWPDGSTGHQANDQPGKHAVHVEEIAKKKFAKSNPDTTEKNSTCNYCHPANTHSGDTNYPADVSMTDTDNTGGADLNTGTKFKRIVSPFADDSTGYWRSTPGTCSLTACHAGAPYTPHWYTDTVPPGNVTLTAALGPVPRSIKLTWTAPGDDGDLDGTAYKYDIRMGDSSLIANDFTSTTNHVKGIPTVKRRLEAQEAIIHGVEPGQTYYFALRTYDENVISNPGTSIYGTSNTASYTAPLAGPAPNPSLDKIAPVLTGSPTWYGLDSAKALDDGTIKLSWTRAEDHSMPITYDVFWSQGAINYTTPQASTKDTSFRVTGLTVGNTYNFAVRAKDAYNNTDTNTVTLQAIPQGLNAVPKSYLSYYANGTATTNIPMLSSLHTVDGSTGTLPAVFIGPTNFTSVTDIIVSSFSVNVVNTNVPTILRAELIYITGTNTPNSFNSATAAQTQLFATDVTVAKRATRLVTFKFNGATRRINAAMAALPVKLGVRVSVSSGAVTSIGWGPTSKGGIFSFAAQPINTVPTPPTVSASVSGAKVNISWAQSYDDTDGVADSVHYDVYGSANGGTDGFPHVIATGLTTNATAGAPLVWDTQAAGIALGASVNNVQVKVEAGDSVNGKTISHTPSTSANQTVNNSGDNVAPGTITNFNAETRPKQGSVYLSWTAPGDDDTNNGRALYYDIRYDTRQIVESGGNGTTTVNFANVPITGQAVSEPYPDFGGNGQGYEVLGLADGNYYFAIKAFDEGGKSSPLAATAATQPAGPKCGICHSTPPDEPTTKGNHAKHGYTMKDCGNCHGTAAANFTTDHQDGAIKLGWKTATPATAIPWLSGYKYQQTSPVAGTVDIYIDGDGSGGFNPLGDNNDDGSCMSWSNQQVSGCHGPATSALWDADPGNTLVCSSCHGVANRPLDAWGHSFDDPSADVKSAPPVDNHGYDGTSALEGERKYVGAHVPHLNYSFRLSKGDSCRMCHGPSRPGSSLHADGHIDVQLDKAAAGPDATWTYGNEDPLPANRTAGTCASLSADSCHPASVGNPTGAVKWDSALNFDCIMCHGMGGTVPSHVTDPNKTVNDPGGNNAVIPLDERMPGNCTWCHVGGHPKEKKITAISKASPAVVTTENPHNLSGGEKVTIHTQTGMTELNNKTFTATVINATQFSLQGSNSTSYGTFDYGTWIEGNGTGVLLIPNDSRVGINYMSGGIHLKANIGNRGEVGSEAELCWGCHTPNNISEWAADDGPANVYTRAGFTNNNYNYGTLYLTPNGTGNWVGASWRSGTTGFGYKDGTIRSTHSTDPTGTAALTGSAYNYSNGGVDVVGKIRCSNCHDVHDSTNSPLEADGLNPDGPPYLRGTWKSNPYKEDGAPQQGTSYTVASSGNPGFGYGAVPRANPSTSQLMGGYWIDQNSGYPTAGWTYESSAGLCQLCHSKTVDNLDQLADSGGLWITATNGHANSALGGSGTGAANIFYHGTGGRLGSGGASLAQDVANTGVWMGFQINYTDTDDYGYGPRSGRVSWLQPYATASVKISALLFAWGNAVDATTVEVGYHSFSCSKCHNPHASRLPKLMITNCLDVALNTWDNNYKVDSTDWPKFNGAASSWGRNRISHLSTAQNCHRYIDVNNDNTPDEKGWNKVTPWGTNNP